MSQKSSLLQVASSVSLALTPDNQTIAVPETHRRGIALSLPPLSVQNALACQKPTSKPIKQSNAAYRGR
jgi:hypothetical protein